MAAVCVLWVGNCRLCCEMGWRKAKSLERTRLSVVHGPSMHRWLECYEGYLLVWPYVTALRTSTVPIGTVRKIFCDVRIRRGTKNRRFRTDGRELGCLTDPTPKSADRSEIPMVFRKNMGISKFPDFVQPPLAPTISAACCRCSWLLDQLQ